MNMFSLSLSSVLAPINEVFFWDHSVYWKCQIHLLDFSDEWMGAGLQSFIFLY